MERVYGASQARGGTVEDSAGAAIPKVLTETTYSDETLRKLAK